jgi:polyhydroxybutyrate depolymerase
MLHGGFGTGTQAERAYGWDALAREARFVLAYPDGSRTSTGHPFLC